jgi:hypothetical protein
MGIIVTLLGLKWVLHKVSTGGLVGRIMVKLIYVD